MQLFGPYPHKMQYPIILPLLALLLLSCGRDSSRSNMPATTNLTGSDRDTPKFIQGRYSLIPVSSAFVLGNFCVIDSQTGQVWYPTLDSEHNIVALVSMDYRNIDGALSKVPNETATGVVFKDQVTQRPPTQEEAAELRAKGIDPDSVLVGDDISHITTNSGKRFPTYNPGPIYNNTAR